MYYLYLKTHNVTGLKYLGVTKKDNPFEYLGSGLHWKRHLKKHGTDISTEILFETPCDGELTKKGLEYSLKWDIVKSDEFANKKLETGYSLYSYLPDYTKTLGQKISESKKGVTFSKEHRQKLSEAKIGSRQSKETIEKRVNKTRGQRRSKEQKLVMSKAQKGRTKSKEHRSKISQTLTGKTPSEECRKKRSIAMKKYWEKRKQNEMSDM